MPHVHAIAGSKVYKRTPAQASTVTSPPKRMRCRTRPRCARDTYLSSPDADILNSRR